MNKFANISEAAAIALHAMVLLVNEQKAASSSYIADKLGVSKHHLSKVLRTLVAGELLSSIKGPNGGFFLSKDQMQTSFMQILETVDGHTKSYDCLFAKKPCPKSTCILSDLMCRLNKEFNDYFNNIKLISFKEKN